jgi:hypothetical protein
VPVVQLAEGDHPDTERSLYIGAGRDLAAAGQFSATQLVANVGCIIYALTRDVTFVNAATIITTRTDDQLVQLATITTTYAGPSPQGSGPRNTIVTGRSNVATGGEPQLVWPPNAQAGDWLNLPSPMQLAAGQRLVLRMTTLNASARFGFVWRETGGQD